MRCLLPQRAVFVCTLLLAFAGAAPAQDKSHLFQPDDVFKLQFASDPQISPDGKHVVYVRNSLDIMKDTFRSSLWLINSSDGSEHHALIADGKNETLPRWSPGGKRIAFISRKDGKAEIGILTLETKKLHALATLAETPADLTWSPDGKQLAFSMFVPEKTEPLINLPKAPPGAQWAPAAKIITKLNYRADGKGYLRDGYLQLFVVSATGGAPQQITSGPHHHKGTICWTKDSQYLMFSANRNKDGDYHPKETDIYRISLQTKKVEKLTHRKGPDADPALSPDGKDLVYVGFDDKYQGHQVTQLYLQHNGKVESLTSKLDRDVHQPIWAKNGKGIYVMYEDHGVGKIGLVALDGSMKPLAQNVGGVTWDRPYASGSFSVANGGTIAYTLNSTQHPADVAVYDPQEEKVRRLTDLNAKLLAGKKLGAVEEFWYESSFDGKKIQGWIMKPPGFDAKKKYPLILEIHGGPFANYGPRFAAEMQLYAAAGYVVFYANPRGSTSYGEKFGNLIHHDYPNHDYDDLMSGVDAVIAKGYIDPNNQFVTGGSGGGILTAWIIGKTKRFKAAVVSKPVINWYSFVLTADIYAFFNQYWFPGPPWDNAEHYLKRSPLSLVKNVTTPTMLITGEEDHRTPMSESEQYYQALKLLKVKAVLVRLPGASHNTTARPSQMLAKVACVVQWFDMHKKGD